MRQLATITVTRSPGTITAALAGEIDLSNAAALEGEITQVADQAAELVIDLTEVSYMDSSGIRMVERVDRRQKQAQRALRLVVHAHSRIEQLLLLTNSDAFIKIEHPPG